MPYRQRLHNFLTKNRTDDRVKVNQNKLRKTNKVKV